MKRLFSLLGGAVTLAFAQAAADPVAAKQAGAAAFFTNTDIAALLAMAFAAAVCGIAQSLALGKALEGMARQPEASGKIQGALLIGLGFIESLAIYVLVIALIIIFANPATPVITG
jgi:F-type H+-transporting ATPase subunit c